MKTKDLKYNRGLTLFKKTMSSKSVYIEKYVSGIQDRDLLVGQKKTKNTYNLLFEDGEMIVRITYGQNNSCVC